MPRPTETALKGRARALLEAMTARARWIYAVPREEAAGVVRPLLLEAKFRLADEDPKARAARFENEAASSTFVLFDSPELDVTLVEAQGAEAPEILAKILDVTGFYAQSQLLGTALDVRDEEASKALQTLAHMVVEWDEDWSDVFLLHLASPDPVIRHEATLSLTVAVMVAREAGPAPALLEEAIARERYPKLKETMQDALNVIRGTTGGPVSLKLPEEP